MKFKLVYSVLCLVIFSSFAFSQTQATSGDLQGTVVDQTGAVVQGATITANNDATNYIRTATSNESGEYKFIGLPPGEYNITTTAPNFKKTVIGNLKVTVGQSSTLEIKLEIGTQDLVVNVDSSAVELIETNRSAVSNTIDQIAIQNLPINERSATGVALTISTVDRDNGRPIGPAPTSGLNIGGQRGRSTLVQVDGADFTDNSINAARSTVSQEAVEEYQVATNSYAAEFGRATGGVINVVTKRGTNDFHGDLFGYLRDKSIQSRPPFAPVAKPDYNRKQYGLTFGGPLAKDRTYFFFAWEGRRRDESGFFTSNVAQGLNASATVPLIPGLNPSSRTFTNITAAQATYINALVSAGVPLLTNPNPAIAAQGQGLICLARTYGFFANSGGVTALTGNNPLASPNDGSLCPAISPALGMVGQRFLLSGTTIPISSIAFRPLNDLQKVFPITDRTNYFSIRGDHNIDKNNQLNLRFGYNPSTLTGIQVESQNQSLGQNDFSRTGITDLKDYSFVAGLTSTLSTNIANEARFNFGERKTVFRSQNGDAVAYNISGTAFIGRELFSPVDRREIRYQFVDNVNVVAGSHTLKFGADVSFVQIPNARFELNFAGLFNFGEFDPTNLAAFPTIGGLAAPNLTPVQSYGLGLPSLYIQGFGNPISKIKNTPIAFFGQDSWKVFKGFTLNYGLRYDFEFTEQIAPTPFSDPLSGINLSASDILAAQNAVGVQQGFPRDKNNFAPRLAFAWDIFNNQKTVVRGAIGLFYDHPLLAVAFNSDIADAAQQQQAVLTPGSPTPTALLNATQVFQGTVIPGVTPGAAASAQYQLGRQRFNDQTFPGFGTVLPFTLPVATDFQYASATQANLAIERQITKNMSLSVSYIFVGAHHLPRPTDLNTPNTALQIENYRRCNGTLPTNTTQVSTVNPAACTAPGVWVNIIPGIISLNATTGQRVIAPAVANFFRPSAPNYFLAQALSGGAVTKAVLDSQLPGTVRTPGIISPFGSVNAQLSDGNSNYNAMKVELNRRFSNNLFFSASYTWSHSIDDSSDLQTLLIPQNVNRFDLEKADSLFDQRHRFVFSGALLSPSSWRSGNGLQKFFSDFSISPIIEISSGRPFNIITNVDTNNDQSTQTDRPSVASDGTLTLPAAFATGSLGRDMGITHGFFNVDFGVTRSIRFNERMRIDLIAQGFNMFNHFNEASASPLFTDVNAFGQRAKNGRYYSISTAAYESRNFQLGLKFVF